MSARKIKGSWYVDFRWKNERLRRLSPANTKGGAEAYECQLRQLLAQHGTIKKVKDALKPKVEARVPKLKDFVERWFVEYVNLENRACERYHKKVSFRRHLLPKFGNHPIDQITLAEVDRYKTLKSEEGLTAKTINNHVSMLQKCLDKARDWTIIASTPRFTRLPLGVAPFKYLENHEVDALLAAAKDSDFEAMILAAVRMGLRYSELIALEWGDVDFVQRMICVKRSEVDGHVNAPKNGRTRYVPMTSEVCDMLQSLSRHGTRVFRRQGRSFYYRTARVHLGLLCSVAGIKKVSWHALRHTFASELSRRHVPLQVIKDLMGHSTLDMTLRYAHVSPDLLRAAIDKLEPERSGPPAVNQPLDRTPQGEKLQQAA